MILVVALLSLATVLLCCWRRRKRQHLLHAEEAALITDKTSTASNTANIARQSQPLGLQTVPIIPLVTAHRALNGVQEEPQYHFNNLQRSSSTSSMPNPYETYNPDRDLPPVPTEHISEPAASLENPTSEQFDSLAEISPSSSRHRSYTTGLTRGTTQTTSSTRASTYSQLHTEMESYQKRLEAHHEKEAAEQSSTDAMGSTSMPVDPPPSYSENVSSTAASDVGHSTAL